MRTIPTRGGKVEEKEEEDLHIVGSGDGKGGGITFMAGEEGKRRVMPKSRGLPANGKKRDGTRANEREIVCARCPLHTMKGCHSRRMI